MSSMYEYLLSSQIKGLLIAFATVSVMMCFVVRSLRLGLLAMIPNLAPIVVGLGVMAIAGIQLDVGTVMIGSIALGLVVDDSVHFLVRLQRNLGAGRSLDRSVDATIAEGGRAMVVTSLALGAGFAILMLGSFVANVYFGAICALIIVLALVADLVVLPAILGVCWRR
jgi:predicted RND superfamily exporter protein